MIDIKTKTTKEKLDKHQWHWYVICRILHNTRGLTLLFLLDFTSYELEQYYNRLFPGE